MDLFYWKKCSFWLGCENEKLLISVFNAKKQLSDRNGNLSLQRPSHPRRPRGGQSGREKRRDKSFHGPVRVGTQGLFRLYLKTFVTPFLPARLTAPGSPRMRPSVFSPLSIIKFLFGHHLDI